MTKQEAEKLAIKLGLSHWDMGDDGFGGEDVPSEKAVNILMELEKPASPSAPSGSAGQEPNNRYWDIFTADDGGRLLRLCWRKNDAGNFMAMEVAELCTWNNATEQKEAEDFALKVLNAAEKDRDWLRKRADGEDRHFLSEPEDRAESAAEPRKGDCVNCHIDEPCSKHDMAIEFAAPVAPVSGNGTEPPFLVRTNPCQKCGSTLIHKLCSDVGYSSLAEEIAIQLNKHGFLAASKAKGDSIDPITVIRNVLAAQEGK